LPTFYQLLSLLLSIANHGHLGVYFAYPSSIMHITALLFTPVKLELAALQLRVSDLHAHSHKPHACITCLLAPLQNGG
jgi:hypothetical protein